MYVPILQPVDRLSGLMLSARLASHSPGGLEAIRREIGRSGADIVVGHVVTLEQQVDRSLLMERLVSRVSGIFGVLGLVTRSGRTLWRDVVSRDGEGPGDRRAHGAWRVGPVDPLVDAA